MFLLYLQKFADKSKKTMVRFRIFIYTLISILLHGCDSQPIPTSMPNKMGSIQSRGIIQETSLPVESEALFNISGGISLTNQIFTFDGTSWKPSENLSYSVNSQESTLTAIYPAYNKDENKLIIENPYVDNSLEDILIAQKSFTDASNIELTFRHLFSLLTIHIESDLQEDVEAIAVTAPKVISMNGTDGTFTTSGEYTTTLSKDGTGDFSFIIPSINNCQLTITFNPGINEITHTLTHDFISGYKYECNVVDEDTRPGIKDADDLIDFSKLINGEISKDNWSKFGYKEGEDTIYCLLNDIKIPDTESNPFNPIGDHEKTPFSAIFDGKGHTISGVKISAANGIAGLFGRITPTGVIKNLQLYNFSSPPITGSASSGVGLLAGVCYGTITNCSVTKSTITVETNYPTGGLIGHLRAGGKILNSYVQNTTITSAGYIGGLAGEVKQANIINCYVASNDIKAVTYSGGIAGSTNQCNITNCYKYNITFNISKNRGQIIGKGENSTIDHIFYDLDNQKLIYDKTNETSTQTNIEQYDTSTFKTTNDNIEIYKLLNQWINNQGTASNLFTLWKSKDDLPAVFQ